VAKDVDLGIVGSILAHTIGGATAKFCAQDETFRVFLVWFREEMNEARKQAMKKGISPRALDAVLKMVEDDGPKAIVASASTLGREAAEMILTGVAYPEGFTFDG
jgi:hypothetical protein